MKQLIVPVGRIAAILLVVTGQTVSQSPSGPKPSSPPQIAENAWMQHPTSLSGSGSSEVAARFRAERDSFWDGVSGERAPLTPDSASHTATGESWFEPSPEIPKVHGRVVLTGTFAAYRSILSASGRSVYTEITINVDEVFQNRSAFEVVHGDNVTVAIAGGTVLTPSGQTLHYLTQPRELFLQPGRKYLLVLSYKQSGQFLTLADQWDISDGTLRVSSMRNRTRVQRGRSSLNGIEVAHLEQALSRLLSEE